MDNLGWILKSEMQGEVEWRVSNASFVRIES